MCPSVNAGHSLLQEMSESWFSVVATMPSQVHVDTSSCLDGEPENASPNVRCAQAKNTDERAGQRWCIGMLGSRYASPSHCTSSTHTDVNFH